jgi:hypothetical protein
MASAGQLLSGAPNTCSIHSMPTDRSARPSPQPQSLGRPPDRRQRPEPRDGALRRDSIGARALEVVLGVAELVETLQADRVLEAAGGMLPREVTDLSIDVSAIGAWSTRSRCSACGTMLVRRRTRGRDLGSPWLWVIAGW